MSTVMSPVADQAAINPPVSEPAPSDQAVARAFAHDAAIEALMEGIVFQWPDRAGMAS